MDNKTVKDWERALVIADDVAKAATAITKAFLHEHDLMHEFDQHLYQIGEAHDENSDEVLAVADMMASHMD